MPGPAEAHFKLALRPGGRTPVWRPSPSSVRPETLCDSPYVPFFTGARSTAAFEAMPVEWCKWSGQKLIVVHRKIIRDIE